MREPPRSYAADRFRPRLPHYAGLSGLYFSFTTPNSCLPYSPFVPQLFPSHTAHPTATPPIRNLALLETAQKCDDDSKGLDWTLVCPGFLRHGPRTEGWDVERAMGMMDMGVQAPRAAGVAAVYGGVRRWNQVNDERLGGLSVTYEDAAVLIAAEALAALSVRPVDAESESQSQSQSEPMKKSAIGGHPNQCLGIESSNGYYTSMPASVVKIVSWQAALLLNSMSK